MSTQKHMGKNELVDRLSAQVGSRTLASRLLRKRGHMKADGSLTAAGEARSRMTARERAIDRESKKSGRGKRFYKYNPKTNQATLS